MTAKRCPRAPDGRCVLKARHRGPCSSDGKPEKPRPGSLKAHLKRCADQYFEARAMCEAGRNVGGAAQLRAVGNLLYAIYRGDKAGTILPDGPIKSDQTKTKNVLLSMKDALALGIVFCECGHPPNNHFMNQPGQPCAHCKCQQYVEEVSRGRIV